MVLEERSPDGLINATRIKTATCCSSASDGHKPPTIVRLKKKRQPWGRSSGGKSDLAEDKMRIPRLYEHEQARNKIGMLSIPFPGSLEIYIFLWSPGALTDYLSPLEYDLWIIDRVAEIAKKYMV